MGICLPFSPHLSSQWGFQSTYVLTVCPLKKYSPNSAFAEQNPFSERNVFTEKLLNIPGEAKTQPSYQTIKR